MSVLELLDELEIGLVRLCAERTRLASALGEAERRLKSIDKALGRTRARRKPSEDSTQPAAEPPAEVVQQTPAARSREPLGKRVALGRGLADLRRTAARP